MRTLVAIPVYNEEAHVARVLEEVRQYAEDVLVIDDGSTDMTPLLLAKQPVEVVRHAQNRGYGQSMIDAIRWVQCYQYDWLVTMDCDEQHEPESLPDFFQAIQNDKADVVSGSRYLDHTHQVDQPPQDRREINKQFTSLVNSRLGLCITDAFCGFKAYRVKALQKLKVDERGYGFPMQFWVQAAAHQLKVSEVPVRLIYNNPNRSFGGPLDVPEQRLAYYRRVFEDEVAKFPGRFVTKEPCVCGTDQSAPKASEKSKQAASCG